MSAGLTRYTCRCAEEDVMNELAECPVHPRSLRCELCRRNEATHWTVEREYRPDTGLGYYEALPVCDDCTPRVASGDRPNEIIAVTQLSLTANAPWI